MTPKIILPTNSLQEIITILYPSSMLFYKSKIKFPIVGIKEFARFIVETAIPKAVPQVELSESKDMLGHITATYTEQLMPTKATGNRTIKHSWHCSNC